MNQTNQTLVLDENMLLMLKALPGKFIDTIGCQKATVVLDQSLAEVSSPILIWISGAGFPISLHYSEFSSIATVPILSIAHETESIPLKNEAMQFYFSNFEISKMEIWAEKTTTQSFENLILTENTLCFHSTDNQIILITPWLPRNGATIHTNPTLIKELLHSNELILKHCFD
jgi:hypothetical protein